MTKTVKSSVLFMVIVLLCLSVPDIEYIIDMKILQIITAAWRKLKTYQFLNFSAKRTQTRYVTPHLNNRREGEKKLSRSEFAIASDAISLRLFIAGAWTCQHPGHPQP